MPPPVLRPFPVSYTHRFGQKTLTVEVLSVAENVGKDAAAAMYREAAAQPDKLS